MKKITSFRIVTINDSYYIFELRPAFRKEIGYICFHPIEKINSMYYRIA